jgi:hypothetical protein
MEAGEDAGEGTEGENAGGQGGSAEESREGGRATFAMFSPRNMARTCLEQACFAVCCPVPSMSWGMSLQRSANLLSCLCHDLAMSCGDASHLGSRSHRTGRREAAVENICCGTAPGHGARMFPWCFPGRTAGDTQTCLGVSGGH